MAMRLGMLGMWHTHADGIVRQVAEQHRGTVGAENDPDGGAVFTIRLPVVAEDQSGGGWLDDPSLARGPEALA